MNDIVDKKVHSTRPVDRTSLIERAAAHLSQPATPADLPQNGATVPMPSMPAQDPFHAQQPPGGVAPLGQSGAAPAQQTVRPDKPAKQSRRVDIDFASLAKSGFLTPGAERSRIAEEFRVIKRPLLRNALAAREVGTRNSNLIMVASSKPGEGKTFTAVNLAISMAYEHDTHVLLVDADLTKPKAAESLGISEELGFFDILEDPKLDLADVMVRTNLNNLSVLPCGRLHLNGTELLASKRTGEILAEMSQRYSDRIIIFDTAPVLACSESSVLALHVDQVVYVVEAEKTNEATIKAGLELISSCENVSLVLNKTRDFTGSEKFGSYYQPYYNG